MSQYIKKLQAGGTFSTSMGDYDINEVLRAFNQSVQDDLNKLGHIRKKKWPEYEDAYRDIVNGIQNGTLTINAAGIVSGQIGDSEPYKFMVSSLNKAIQGLTAKEAEKTEQKTEKVKYDASDSGMEAFNQHFFQGELPLGEKESKDTLNDWYLNQTDEQRNQSISKYLQFWAESLDPNLDYDQYGGYEKVKNGILAAKNIFDNSQSTDNDRWQALNSIGLVKLANIGQNKPKEMSEEEKLADYKKEFYKKLPPFLSPQDKDDAWNKHIQSYKDQLFGTNTNGNLQDNESYKQGLRQFYNDHWKNNVSKGDVFLGSYTNHSIEDSDPYKHKDRSSNLYIASLDPAFRNLLSNKPLDNDTLQRLYHYMHLMITQNSQDLLNIGDNKYYILPSLNLDNGTIIRYDRNNAAFNLVHLSNKTPKLKELLIDAYRRANDPTYAPDEVTFDMNGGIIKFQGGGNSNQALNYDLTQEQIDSIKNANPIINAAISGNLDKVYEENRQRNATYWTPLTGRNERSQEAIQAGSQPYYKLSKHDMVRIASAAANLASIFTPPNIGLGIGAASDVIELGNNIADKSVDLKEALSQFGSSAVMDALALVPGQKLRANANKIWRSIGYLSPVIQAYLVASNLGQSVVGMTKSFKKMESDPQNMTVDDYKNLFSGLGLFLQSAMITKNAVNAKTKRDLYTETKKVPYAETKYSRVYLTPELSESIKKAGSLEEQNKLLQSFYPDEQLKSEHIQTTWFPWKIWKKNIVFGPKESPLGTKRVILYNERSGQQDMYPRRSFGATLMGKSFFKRFKDPIRVQSANALLKEFGDDLKYAQRDALNDILGSNYEIEELRSAYRTIKDPNIDKSSQGYIDAAKKLKDIISDDVLYSGSPIIITGGVPVDRFGGSLDYIRTLRNFTGDNTKSSIVLSKHENGGILKADNGLALTSYSGNNAYFADPWDTYNNWHAENIVLPWYKTSHGIQNDAWESTIKDALDQWDAAGGFDYLKMTDEERKKLWGGDETQRLQQYIIDNLNGLNDEIAKHKDKYVISDTATSSDHFDNGQHTGRNGQKTDIYFGIQTANRRPTIHTKSNDEMKRQWMDYFKGLGYKGYYVYKDHLVPTMDESDRHENEADYMSYTSFSQPSSQSTEVPQSNQPTQPTESTSTTASTSTSTQTQATDTGAKVEETPEEKKQLEGMYAQISSLTRPQREYDWNKLLSNLHNAYPNAIALGRLADNIYTAKGLERLALKNQPTRKGFKDQKIPVRDDLHGVMTANAQANRIASQMGQPRTSDASINMASMLEGLQKAGQLNYEAQLKSNDLMRQTIEKQLGWAKEVRDYNLPVKDFNFTAFIEDANHDNNVRQATKSNIHTNIQTWLEELQYLAGEKNAERKANQLYLDEKYLAQLAAQEAANSSEYQGIKAKLIDEYDKDKPNAALVAEYRKQLQAIQNRYSERLWRERYRLYGLEPPKTSYAKRGGRIDDSDIKKRQKDHDRLVKEVLHTITHHQKALDNLSKGQLLSIKKLLS